MRVDQLSCLDCHGGSNEHQACVGGGAETELLAARLLPWGWVSVVPAFRHHGELETGPSSQLFFSLLYFLTRYHEGLSLSFSDACDLLHRASHPRVGFDELEAEGWAG